MGVAASATKMGRCTCRRYSDHDRIDQPCHRGCPARARPGVRSGGGPWKQGPLL